MSKVDLARLALALTMSIATVDLGSAQQSATPQAPWAGWARCQITVTGLGYSDQQTHTWMITGGTPTVQGVFRLYPGTWSVVGGGSLQRTQGRQTLMAQWATNGPSRSAPIAVFVRASDKRMLISAGHAQLRSAAAIQGYQQVTIDGKPQTPGKIAAEAFEWAFPEAAVSRPNPNANLIANGSSTPVVSGSVGLMQPGGSQATASCTWQFSQGAAPAPPPALTAQPIPTPPAQPAGGAANGAASGSTPACPSPPQNLVASATPMTTPTIGATHTVSLQWTAPASGVATAYAVRAGSAPGLSDLRDFTQAFVQTSSSFGAKAGSYYIRVYAAGNCAVGGSTASNEVLLVIN